MNSKTLVVLAVAAIATAAVAAISLVRRDAAVTTARATADSSRSSKDSLFPGLLDRVNEVDTVTIKKPDGTITLRKSADSWGLAEKNGFAIEMEPVRKMLIAMGEMHKVESKTSDPARYEQIGVQDPEAAGSKSTLVVLKDASGKDLAQLILGKEHASKGAAFTNQRYVRKPGEAQSWLVQGSFDLKEKGSDWLEKKIVEVKRDRVRSVEITQPDGELLVVDRPDAKTNDFTLLEVPEGKELTYPTAPGSVGSGLEYVNLEDVEPVEKIDFTTQPGPVAKFKTFDGLVVTVTTVDKDGKTWAKFDASYEAPPPAPVPPAEPPATTPEDPATGAIPAATPALKSPEEVQQEAADLDERLSKWAYQISSYSRANLGKKKSELLKDKAPPPDPNAPGEDAFMIPDSLPPEIQQQIKADQEARGNKVVIKPAPAKPEETPPVPPVPAPQDPPKPGDVPKPTDPPKPVDPPHPHPHPPSPTPGDPPHR